MGFSNSLTYDEALSQYVGEFGRGQRNIVAVTSLYYIPNAVIFYLLVFLTKDPITQRLWQCTDAADSTCNAVWQSPDVSNFCELAPSQWQWTTVDNLACYFNMVCNDKWKVQLLNMMMFIGCLIGAALFGHLNDKYGRKKPLLGATILCVCSVFLSAATPRNGYWMMAFVRLVTGIGAVGQNQCVALLNTEIAGRSRRGRSAIMSGIFWPTGEFVLVGLAYVVHNWRVFTVITGAMSIAALVLYPWIPESTRWLLSQGRLEEATAVVQQIAAWNGTKMPPIPLKAAQPAGQQAAAPEADAVKDAESMPTAAGTNSSDGSGHHDVELIINSSADSVRAAADLQALPLPAAGGVASGSGDVRSSPAGVAPAAAAAAAAAASGQKAAGPGQQLGLMYVLSQPKLLVRTLVMIFTWFSLYIVSYGVNLGAGALPGSVYVTFTLLTVAELTAQLMTVLIADKAGRHVIVAFGLVLSGTACLVCAATQDSTARAALAVLGKYGCTVGMAVLGAFSTELFATPIRASAMGILNEAGRLGSIIAPLMLMVGAQVKPQNAVFVPFLAFGLSALLAGVLTLVLPETLGAPMAEDIDDMHQLLSLFSAKPWQQGPVATIKFLFRARAVKAARRRGQALSPEPARQHQQQQSNKATQVPAAVITVVCSAQVQDQAAGSIEPGDSKTERQ